jgi:hypothetical protein
MSGWGNPTSDGFAGEMPQRDFGNGEVAAEGSATTRRRLGTLDHVMGVIPDGLDRAPRQRTSRVIGTVAERSRSPLVDVSRGASEAAAQGFRGPGEVSSSVDAPRRHASLQVRMDVALVGHGECPHCLREISVDMVDWEWNIDGGPPERGAWGRFHRTTRREVRLVASTARPAEWTMWTSPSNPFSTDIWAWTQGYGGSC